MPEAAGEDRRIPGDGDLVQEIGEQFRQERANQETAEEDHRKFESEELSKRRTTGHFNISPSLGLIINKIRGHWIYNNKYPGNALSDRCSQIEIHNNRMGKSEGNGAGAVSEPFLQPAPVGWRMLWLHRAVVHSIEAVLHPGVLTLCVPAVLLHVH